jgi:hypothetical protein
MREKLLQRKTLLGLNLNFDTLVLYSLYLLSVLIPLLIGKPQLLVGSLVNFLITYSTLKYNVAKTTPILLLPSITATTTGILFDGATHFLLYVMPFIMISNLILSYFMNKRNIPAYILGILLKGTFLFVAYYIMNLVVGLPKVFISSVNIQFITATIGVISAVSLYNLENKKI